MKVEAVIKNEPVEVTKLGMEQECTTNLNHIKLEVMGGSGLTESDEPDTFIFTDGTASIDQMTENLEDDPLDITKIVDSNDDFDEMRIDSDDATYIVNNDDMYDNIDNIYDNVDDSYYITDVDGTYIFDFDKVIAEAKSQKSNNTHSSRKCSECEYTSSRLADLGRHMLAEHHRIQFPCEHCNYVAKHVSNLNRHIRSIHQGVRFSCNECNFSSKRQDDLNRHMASKHQGLRYSCTHCDYKATLISNLKRHFKRKHNTSTACTIKQLMQRQFVQQKQLGKLQREQKKACNQTEKQDEQLFTRDYVSDVSSDLSLHQNTKNHDDIDTKDRIDISSDGVANGSANGGEVDSDKKVSTNKRKRIQLVDSNSNDSEKPVRKCHHCNFSATFAWQVVEHVRECHRGREYPCAHCSHVATRRNNLNRHVRSCHLGVRYPCPECTYAAKRREDLRYHMQCRHGLQMNSKHSKTAFACDECGFLTLNKDDLRMHMDAKHCGVSPSISC